MVEQGSFSHSFSQENGGPPPDRALKVNFDLSEEGLVWKVFCI